MTFVHIWKLSQFEHCLQHICIALSIYWCFHQSLSWWNKLHVYLNVMMDLLVSRTPDYFILSDVFLVIKILQTDRWVPLYELLGMWWLPFLCRGNRRRFTSQILLVTVFYPVSLLWTVNTSSKAKEKKLCTKKLNWTVTKMYHVWFLLRFVTGRNKTHLSRNWSQYGPAQACWMELRA